MAILLLSADYRELFPLPYTLLDALVLIRPRASTHSPVCAGVKFCKSALFVSEDDSVKNEDRPRKK